MHGGNREDGTWVRLYPVPFRRLGESEQYRLFDWITCPLVRHSRDPRPESYRPTGEIERVDHVGTADNWRERRQLLLAHRQVHGSLSELIEAAKNNISSLAVFKPARLIRFEWETGMAVPTHGMDLGSGMDSPLFIGEHYGLGFACGSTSTRVGLDVEAYVLSYYSHQLWSTSGGVDISGLLGRVEREFALGNGPRAPWIVVSGRVGRMEFRSRGSRHAGVAAGAGVQFGLRFARPWSVLLHLGTKNKPRSPGDGGNPDGDRASNGCRRAVQPLTQTRLRT